jgi:hypothetical protein
LLRGEADPSGESSDACGCGESEFLNGSAELAESSVGFVEGLLERAGVADDGDGDRFGHD